MRLLPHAVKSLGTSVSARVDQDDKGPFLMPHTRIALNDIPSVPMFTLSVITAARN